MSGMTIRPAVSAGTGSAPGLAPTSGAPVRKPRRTPAASTAATKAGRLDLRAVGRLGATAREVAPNVYLLFFADAARMALTFMRFQEYYESPEFAGRTFTRAEFEAWYASEHEGQFTYATDWGGFNVPSRVFEPFAAGRFAPLTADEQTMLAAVANLKAPYYVIGSASEEVVAHELAHGLYATQPAYRGEVVRLLSQVDLEPIFTALKHLGYHRAVLLDEAHAYLCDGGGELADEGVDLAPYRKTITALRKTFKRFAAEAERAAGERLVA